MSESPDCDVGSRLAWTALFGVAFGWVEAAVVVYLRRIVYPGGFVFPLRAIEPSLLKVEVVREAATLLMLLAVARLAGRTRWERWGQFLVAFGVWDLAYYAGLKVALGWPAAWSAPDILFLLPAPWVGPVYAPASVAILMTVVGAAVARAAAARRPLRADAATWVLALLGAAVVLWTFLRDPDAGYGLAVPRPYPVGALLAGDALLAASAWRFLRSGRGRPRGATDGGGRVGPRGGGP